ncbi:hypothetical protein CEXT_251781 [Caerostris extrusa]|uniref:Uncharacterized protein n=1 Tax=Caerostris extrusa TaxID=172846 RepID=A0AAV4R0J0_CAEEX|nr:hypothetical protein CEXT_251781 [Caerostris extrusa]
MDLLQTACLSDWFEFMIRTLRHDSRASNPDAWRDKGWQGGLREMYFTGGLHLHPRNAGLNSSIFEHNVVGLDSSASEYHV